MNAIQLRFLDTLCRGEHDWSRLFSIDLDRRRSIEVNPEAADQRREKMRGNYYDWSKKTFKLCFTIESNRDTIEIIVFNRDTMEFKSRNQSRLIELASRITTIHLDL